MAGENCKAIKYLFFLSIFLAACVKDKPTGPDTNPYVDPTAKNVYIVCEGSFGNGNSALSLYRPETDSVYEDVYHSANNQSMGDVFQSMSEIDDRLFLCVNNSDKILVVNKDNWTLIGTIAVSKPRYIQVVSSTKAYVSSLYTNKVTIINPQTLQVTGTVTMPGNNPEGMLLHNGKVYVALWDTAVNKLYAINANTDHVSMIQTLQGAAPKEIVLDKYGKLWVLGGNIQKNKAASLTRIDPDNNQPIAGFTFPSTADPLRLVTNPAKDKLYFIEVNYSGGSSHNGIYQMDITDTQLPSTALIQAQPLQYFWALGIEPGSGDIYVGDPKGFTQKGSVSIYLPDGSLRKTFSCGVGPGQFYFN